jgi:hypothetical protein
MRITTRAGLVHVMITPNEPGSTATRAFVRAMKVIRRATTTRMKVKREREEWSTLSRSCGASCRRKGRARVLIVGAATATKRRKVGTSPLIQPPSHRPVAAVTVPPTQLDKTPMKTGLGGWGNGEEGERKGRGRGRGRGEEGERKGRGRGEGSGEAEGMDRVERRGQIREERRDNSATMV